MSNHLYLDITYSCVGYVVYVLEEIWHIVEINGGFSSIYVLINVTKMYVIINKLMANWWLKTIIVIPLQN